MEIVTDASEWIRSATRNADSLYIASAYFHPDEGMRRLLSAVPEVTIVVSGEYQINNPRVLEGLSGHCEVWHIPPENDSGRFHAKVVLCEHDDGYQLALIGSANFTGAGFVDNLELSVALDSRHTDDRGAIERVREWLDALPRTRINWNEAKEIWRRRPRGGRKATSQPNYWILKTTEGSNGRSHWTDFLREGVLAIGWEDVAVPAEMRSADELPDDLSGRAKNQIWSYVREWRQNDLVVVSRGYTGPQTAPVHLYGFARVIGDYRYDRHSTWWRHKRDADIQEVNVEVPKRLFVDAIENGGSLLGTVHPLSQEEFDSLTQALEQAVGVVVNI